jgi:hypothetical protein
VITDRASDRDLDLELARAAADRAEAAADRVLAADDRAEAAADRVLAADDRAEAARDLAEASGFVRSRQTT